MMTVRRHERQENEVQVGVDEEEVPRGQTNSSGSKCAWESECSWERKKPIRMLRGEAHDLGFTDPNEKHDMTEVRAMPIAAPFRPLCQAGYIIIMTCIQVDPWNPLLASLHSHSLVPLLPSLLMTTRTYFHLRPSQCLQSQVISSRCMCRIPHTLRVAGSRPSCNITLA